MSDLQQAFEVLREDILLEAEVRGVFQQEAFFELYAASASDNGDTIDLEYTHSHKEGGRRPYRIDGYGFDTDRGTLYLAVCDYRDGKELESIHNDRLTSVFKQAIAFFENACSSVFINSIEETSPAFAAAYPIYSTRDLIKRVRIILFSNARLATKRPPQLGEQVGGLPTVYSVLDATRYFEIQKSFQIPESIEVNIAEIAGEPIACLKASTNTEEHQSYLLAIPGPVLAEVYGLYGARLLEQNVRTYLQAKTKVNKGILETIKKTPEMFFAYNNGLTATASAVKLEILEDGQLGIAAIHNLQIVNGGQTTASILYAKDVANSPLERVYVQMKLSVVPPAHIEQVVPKISRYANTQNRISEADFFSSHPFHLQMERYSRIMTAPPQNGAMTGDKWFYERARGQYRDGMAYASVAGKKKYQLEYPREKIIEKTDLAKYLLSFERKPYIVSRGAQKAFMGFADQTAKAWKSAPTQFNELWYRNACAMGLIFRWTDKHVAGSDWYKDDRGYKSQTVAYTLSWIAEEIDRQGKASLNWGQIWNTQSVPEELQELIASLAPQVAAALRNTSANVRNVGEYCKLEICWQNIRAAEFNVQAVPDHLVLDENEMTQEKKEAKSSARIDSEIDFDVLLHMLGPKAEIIRRTAEQHRFLSPKADRALQKIGSGNLNLARPDKNAIKLLVKRMAEEGMPVEDM
ncbi:AIPR family protein [Pseudomonas asgharzadehiana]|uniref:AIPR family protein n=1 Tax=Pseudomonas asgharzadehiana TaxID=2842349 RepID=A0ABX8NYN2_9PSED|nr:AIPR family protein [Pseudomonas asgharzadehiana]QXH66726.1 AIPR family protein [Pseudomonas asgharzadehiana]